MRYRRLSYRYSAVVHSSPTWPFGDIWETERLRLLILGRWSPDVDVYETATTIEMVVDLAGVEDSDVEVQFFEDVIIVEGQRRAPVCHESAVYHAAGIRRGPFRVELPFPAPIDPDRVETQFDRGLLRITLPKA
jgi:HSP20 family protein